MASLQGVNYHHWLFYQDLGAHSPRTFGAKRAVMELKKSALLYGGVFVSDSDLNNSPRFWCLTDKSSDEHAELVEALKVGFIRRAARFETGTAVSQAHLFAQYQANNPNLAAKVPESHPRVLDRLLSSIEREFPACHLDLRRLSPVFRDRLIVSLAGEPWSKDKDAVYRRECSNISSRMIDCLTDHLDDAEGLRGASLIREFLTASPGDTQRRIRAKQRISHLLKQAYNGNVPAALDGDVLLRLSDNPHVPAGPAQSETLEGLEPATEQLDLQIAAQKYEALFRLNAHALNQLSFSDIAKLREPAEKPGAFFDKRFKALSSPSEMANLYDVLRASSTEYFSFLAQQCGVILPVSGSNLTKVAEGLVIRQAAHDEASKFGLAILLAALGLVAFLPGPENVTTPIEFLLAGQQFGTLILAALAILEARKRKSGPIAVQARELARLVEGPYHARRLIETTGRPDYRAFAVAREHVLHA